MQSPMAAKKRTSRGPASKNMVMASAPGAAMAASTKTRKTVMRQALEEVLAPDDAGHVDAHQDHGHQEGDAEGQQHAQ